MKEVVQLELDYNTYLHAGSLTRGVVLPQHVSEIVIWTEDHEEFDVEKDQFVSTGRTQYCLTGSKRALFELGKYLIALSKLDANNSDYKDIFEGVGASVMESEQEIIVYGSGRYNVLNENKT